jgi:hypothetical protein
MKEHTKLKKNDPNYRRHLIDDIFLIVEDLSLVNIGLEKITGL